MRWSENELAICISLIKEKKTYKEISDLLKRSEGSIRNKLNEIGDTYIKYKDKIKSTECLNCTNKFKHSISEDRKFCSRSCSVTFNNLNKIKFKNSCLNCEKNIIKGRKFCCRDCYLKNRITKIEEKIENGNLTLYSKSYKKYLIEKYGEKCMKCNWCEIHPLTGKVPIQMEHKDGNSYNNSLENLELLCPNCHSLTLTYGALNKGNGRKNRKR